MIDVQVDEVLNLAAKIVYVAVNLRTERGEVVLVNEDADKSNQTGE